VVLILLTLTFIDARKSGSSADLYGREKDVLQFVLPILGTVLGYYFGRVPAERRAESAEQTASGDGVTSCPGPDGRPWSRQDPAC